MRKCNKIRKVNSSYRYKSKQEGQEEEKKTNKEIKTDFKIYGPLQKNYIF